MKRSQWILALMLPGVVGSVDGCNKAAPTEPGGGAFAMAACASSASDLSGVWCGTIACHAHNEKLTGQFQSGCGGLLEIRGVINETSLFGSLWSPTGPGFGRIVGSVSSSRIRFRTIQLANDQDDPNGRDNDGDAAYTSTEVELVRSSPLRSSPLIVDQVRSSRLLPDRR